MSKVTANQVESPQKNGGGAKNRATGNLHSHVHLTARSQTPTPQHRIIHLQRTLGNRAMERMWNSGALQAKLNIGPANDKYEQEADRVADQVVSMSEPGPPPSSLGENPMGNSTPLQRKNPSVFAGGAPQVSRAPLADMITPLQRSAINMWGEAEAPLGAEAGGETSPRLTRFSTPFAQNKGTALGRVETAISASRGHHAEAQRSQLNEEEEEKGEAKTILNRKTGWGIPHQDRAVPAIVESSIHSARRGGRPLSPVERSYYEPRFGADFSGVKIHTDSTAAQLSRSVNARAFTVGRDIFFGSGQYTSHTNEGRRLMAHELTHTIQQKGRQGGESRWVARQVYGDDATGYTDPKAVFSFDDFIKYVKAVERGYPDEKPQEVLTRIRNQYYGDFKFKQLIPDAPHSDIVFVSTSMGVIPVRVTRKISKGRIGHEAYSHLTARADENALGDNPSPYVKMPNGRQWDLGHLLLSLDSLLHPRTSWPYTTFNVPGIDPASWVADIGIAAVWWEQHKTTGEPPKEMKSSPDKPDIEKYYKLSAPEEDLIADVDSFGVHVKWVESSGGLLSEILNNYYKANSKGASVDKRWQLFCNANNLAFMRNGNSITWHKWVTPMVELRVNDFNDMFDAGMFGVVWQEITGVKKKKWQKTPYVVKKFLDWVKKNLEQELAGEKK